MKTKDIDSGQKIWGQCDDCSHLGWIYSRRKIGKVLSEKKCLNCWRIKNKV